MPDDEIQITVLVVDHNPILLEGIAVLIRSQPDMKLVGTATTAEAAIALYVRTRAIITVIDLELPDSAAITAIRRILLANSNAKLIGLTTYERDTSRPEPSAAGLMAIVATDRIEEQLVALIRSSIPPRS